MKKILFLISTLILSAGAWAQVRIDVHESAKGQPIIPAGIYGQFSEHLGRCIYEGIWVGPDSPIPNEDGYRTDVLEALKALKIPVLRWPGGCFADEYHWMDGIGPREQRPKMVNTNWGGTVEDNSFGTHEFLDFCERIGAQPYISTNVGSGTVEEMAKWVEYVNASGGSMAELRARNGRKEPWNVKYIGVGNESWGCGGNMTAQYYSDVYKRYALYARNYDGKALCKIACGASDYDYEWTKVLMKNAGRQMSGLSLHFYTIMDWNHKGSATEFTSDDYYNTLGYACRIDEVLSNHEAIMDAYDPQRRVALILDEWGTWYDVEPGTNPGHLFQQNTMRDAMVAALSLNIFNRHTYRLKMANIAQLANVLQAMVLTDKEKMVLTPTYHVFRMYNVHQDATFVPADTRCGQFVSERGDILSEFSSSASRDAAGILHLSLANPRLDKQVSVEITFDELKPSAVSGEILNGREVNAHNDFVRGETVRPEAFQGARISGRKIKLTLPPASIVVLEVR